MTLELINQWWDIAAFYRRHKAIHADFSIMWVNIEYTYDVKAVYFFFMGFGVAIRSEAHSLHKKASTGSNSPVETVLYSRPCPEHKGECWPESYRDLLVLTKYTVIHGGIKEEIANIAKTYAKIGVKPVFCEKCRYFVFEK